MPKTTTNGANIHSLCCNFPEYYNPNFYLDTEISNGISSALLNRNLLNPGMP